MQEEVEEEEEPEKESFADRAKDAFIDISRPETDPHTDMDYYDLDHPDNREYYKPSGRSSHTVSGDYGRGTGYDGGRHVGARLHTRAGRRRNDPRRQRARAGRRARWRRLRRAHQVALLAPRRRVQGHPAVRPLRKREAGGGGPGPNGPA